MKNRTRDNKKAWEQAYEHRNYDEETVLATLRDHPSDYLNDELRPALDAYIKPGSAVMQFCANNGRELLAICKHYAVSGHGFDLAENMIRSANEKAAALNLEASFQAVDILEIPESFHNQADVLVLTVGTTAWFEDIRAFFTKCRQVLRPGGILILQEIHPLTLMLAAESEDNYDPDRPFTLVNDYFAKKEWVSTSGMGYMSDLKQSYPFFDYSHTLADHVNAIIASGLTVRAFDESPVDYGDIFGANPPAGCPLAMLLIAGKPSGEND